MEDKLANQGRRQARWRIYWPLKEERGRARGRGRDDEEVPICIDQLWMQMECRSGGREGMERKEKVGERKRERRQGPQVGCWNWWLRTLRLGAWILCLCPCPNNVSHTGLVHAPGSIHCISQGLCTTTMEAHRPQQVDQSHMQHKAKHVHIEKRIHSITKGVVLANAKEQGRGGIVPTKRICTLFPPPSAFIFISKFKT